MSDQIYCASEQLAQPLNCHVDERLSSWVTCTRVPSLLWFPWHCRHWLLVMLMALYYLCCGTGRCKGAWQ